jgi:hypothetical protein
VNRLSWLYNIAIKDYEDGYRLASKIKDEGFEEDLYTKHCALYSTDILVGQSVASPGKFLQLIYCKLKSDKVYNSNVYT